MKWIAVAIVLVIIPYTFLTLRFRKPGPAFQPYADMKDRANVTRLLSAGYQRIPLPALRPAEPLRSAGTTFADEAPGGLPAELKATLVDTPLLPTDILGVSAPRTGNTLQPYPIQFTCILPDDKQQLAGADLYLKDYTVVITPSFERVSGTLQSRTREPIVLVTIPAGTLKPGNYHVTLAGERTSRAWSLEVR
jgi:hypothetical protein